MDIQVLDSGDNNYLRSKKEEFTGRRFGRLLVICPSTQKNYWLCACACGATKKARTDHLRHGKTKSCGCLRKQNSTKHGKSKLPEYRTWLSMLQRCCSPTHSSYSLYGARGIRVCASWYNLSDFLSDMGSRPTPNHSLDRVDSNGDYCKANCRWATKSEQQRNRRDSLIVAMDGISRPLGDWCDDFGLPYKRTANRVYRGWEPRELFFGKLWPEAASKEQAI